MTETSTEAVVAPQAAPAPPVDKPPEPAPQSAGATVEHTPGGWPVVPLAVSGTNSSIGLIAAASLTGGPIGAAVAATGAAVIGAAAAIRLARRQDRKGAAGGAGRGRAGSPTASVGRTSRPGTGGRVPTQGRGTGRKSAGSGGGRGLSKSTGTGSRSRTAGAGSGMVGGAGKPRTGTGTGTGAGRSGGRSPIGSRSGNRPAGRIGQVQALRRERAAQAATRGAARTQGTQARRAVADSRREARAAARDERTPSKGAVGRAVSRGRGAMGRARDAAVRRARAARDRRNRERVDGKRSDIRKGPSRRRARAALWRSAARMHTRRLLAAVLATPLGVLGMFTTPLGRKLGWHWLQYPGRRLYRRIVGAARQARAERDQAIRDALVDEEAALDAEDEEEIGERVERPDRYIPSSPAPYTEVWNMSGFRFEEAAAEMETAARSYEPDGAMEILAMVENLPQALTSVANTFRILAERSDSEFPLEKEVAVGFDDIFEALMRAVAVSEELGPLFRLAHEQDIARHEDPRNGPEAEKGWNV